jgi:hypothetical protein
MIGHGASGNGEMVSHCALAGTQRQRVAVKHLGWTERRTIAGFPRLKKLRGSPAVVRLSVREAHTRRVAQPVHQRCSRRVGGDGGQGELPITHYPLPFTTPNS